MDGLIEIFTLSIFSDDEDYSARKSEAENVMDSDEEFPSDSDPGELELQPPTKKVRPQRNAARAVARLENELTNSNQPFKCMRNGCPSFGKTFKSKDGINKHNR